MRNFVSTAALAVVLLGCADHPTSPTATLPVKPPTISEAMILAPTAVFIPPDTMSKASDIVHPDILDFAASGLGSWNRKRCYQVYTPYLDSNNRYENPSILVSDDCQTWTVPEGTSNPVVPFPGANAYNSDPDLSFDESRNELVMLYRVVAEGFNKIQVATSADGRTWPNQGRNVIKVSNHDAVSPTMVIEKDTVKVWFVESGPSGCTSGGTAVKMRYAVRVPGKSIDQLEWKSGPEIKMAQKDFRIWHFRIKKLPGSMGYIALFAAYYKTYTCASDEVFLATSKDGINWETFAVPILWRTMPGFSLAAWYRTTMLYNPATDRLDIWPSAIDKNGLWTEYHAAYNYSKLLAALRAAKEADLPRMIRFDIPQPSFERNMVMP